MSYISFKQVRKEYVMGEVKIKAGGGVDLEIENWELERRVGTEGGGRTWRGEKVRSKRERDRYRREVDGCKTTEKREIDSNM